IHRGASRHPSIFFRFTHAQLGWPESYKGQYTGGGSYTKKLKDAIDDPVEMEFEFVNNTLRINGWKATGKMADGSYVYYDKDEVCRYLIGHLNIVAGYNPGWGQVENFYKQSFLEGLKSYLSKIIYIPDFREITNKSREGDGGYTSSISGQNIIEE